MQPETSAQPIIRTYKGRDKRAAEGAYRADSRQAAVSGWVPVAHRWTESWEGHELAVVFEQRAGEVLRAPTMAVGGAAAAAASPGRDEREAPSEVAAYADADQDAPVVLDDALPAAATADAAATGGADQAVDAGADDDGPRADEVSAPDDPGAMSWADTGVPADEPGAVASGWAAPDTEDAGAPLVHPPAPESVTAARAHARAVLQTLELHCAGEPLRLIRTGYPQVPDVPILERRRWVTEHADWAR